MGIQRVRSKWSKTKALLKSPDLRAYIPHTKKFSRDALRSMIGEYGMVYVKPVSGTHGDGVIRVEHGAQGYHYQVQKNGRSASTLDELYEGLSAYTGKKSYLIQKGIHLLKHKSRRFDLRVLVQRNLSRNWETTAIICRLAAPNNVVTNYHSGGSIKTFDNMLSHHLSSTELRPYEKRLHKLGVSIARQLSVSYPGLKEIGVDIAIDTKLHPWILEVNTKPHPYIYKTLADKSIYRKVRKYSIAYGGMKARR
ncbi:YheC/YheD family protein [Paenibacillus sp. GCM10027627]|uniref:YheC/YheD family protein n=1 Tax=unclassified Paenibacillus TaxID=185978 RepID=UPI00363F1C46